MQRRDFIRLAGGGTVASALALAGCAPANTYPAEAVQAWQPPQERDPRRRAVAYAITAPNPHNRQPWLVDLRTPGTITLYCDRERLLPETDPFGRQILIGHGAFLELLVLALAEQGLAADVALWPEGPLPEQLGRWDARPVATLRLRAGAAPDPLFSQVLLRRTPKVDFDTARTVPAPVLDQLLASAAAGPVAAAGTLDAQRVQALRTLCWEAALAEIGTPRTAMESLVLTRVGPDEILRYRDGISINGWMPRAAAALGMLDRTQPPAPGSIAEREMHKRFSGHSKSAMGFVWLATHGNSRAQQIEAGRAYVRLQLQATALGLGMHPMSQALQEFAEMAPHYARAHQLLLGRAAPRDATEPTVQMLCRVGYPGAAIAPTPRRALGDFLRA